MPKRPSAAQDNPADEKKETAGAPEQSPDSTIPSTKKSEKPDTLGAEAALAALEARADEAEAKAAECQDRLLRTAAEYENFRKRSQKDYESSFGSGLSHAILALLPVLDTLEAAAGTDTSDEEYKKGILMTLTTAQEAFSKMGVKEIDALGKPFDPALHNAVMQEEAEGAESGAVTRVMQKGYTQNDKVIRYAMVAVAP